ncbi:MAG: hypothetical protein WC515_01025 [Candidatus Omnitrophota bacterium]
MKPIKIQYHPFAVFIMTVMAIFAIYYPGIGHHYFNDDYKFVFENPSSKIFYFFTHTNPGIHTYRPLQAMFAALIQTFFGSATWPMQIVQISLHILLCTFVYRFVVYAGFGRLPAFLSALYMAVGQINVLAVLGNDAFNHIASVFFGALGLFFIYSAHCEPKTERMDLKYYLASLLCFTVSIFMKENGISYLLIIPFVITCYEIVKGRRFGSLMRSFALTVPFFVIFAIYYIIRSYVVVPPSHSSQDNYTIGFGFYVIKNLIMQGSSAIMPWSSIDIYFSIISKNVVKITFYFVTTFIFWIIAGYGLMKAKNKAMLAAIGIISVMALFPTFLILHVSEMYTYSAMPYVSILAGIGAGKAIESATGKNRRVLLASIVLIILVMMSVQAIAVRNKAVLMKKSGEESARVVRQIEPWLSKIPENGELVLVNPETREREYSLFYLKGFNVIAYGAHDILHQKAGRGDFGVSIIEEKELSKIVNKTGMLFLTIKNGEVNKL